MLPPLEFPGQTFTTQEGLVIRLYSYNQIKGLGSYSQDFLFFCNLIMGSVSSSVSLCMPLQPSVMQHFSLLGPFVIFQENLVL